MQVYFLLPLLLCLLQPRRACFRKRVMLACVVAMALSVLYQVHVVAGHKISLPLPLFAIWDADSSAGHSAEARRMAWAFYMNIYASLFARTADVAAGVWVYLAATSPSVCHTLRAHRQACTLAAAVASLGSAAQIFSGIAALQPESDSSLPFAIRLAGLIGIVGLWSLLAVSWLLLYMIVQPDDASAWVAAMLSSPKWTPLADRSYSISLLHWPLMLMIFRWIPITAVIGPLHSFSTFCAVFAIVFVASFGAAAVQDAVIGWVMHRQPTADRMDTPRQGHKSNIKPKHGKQNNLSLRAVC